MSVGQDLLDVPFPKMVLSLAQAISKGQLAMDKTSLDTLQMLARTKFDWLPEVTEVLTPLPRVIDTGQKDDNNQPVTVTVTGVEVDFQPADPVKLTMLQAGILPTFYQFTESIIEVKMSISSKTETSSELEAGASLEVTGGFLFASATFSSHVNYKTASKYSYSVDGSSLLRTTLRPAPAPTRLLPRFITVNALVKPPQISISE
jgi:hypothetical protein